MARRWLESIILKDGKAMCHRCNGTNTGEVKNGRPLQHKCRNCRKLFSVRHGLIFEGSHIPLRKWAIAICLVATNLKGFASMKLHRALNITQNSAWYMLHRIRKHSRKMADCSTARLKYVRLLLEDLKRTSMNQRNKSRGGGNWQNCCCRCKGTSNLLRA